MRGGIRVAGVAPLPPAPIPPPPRARAVKQVIGVAVDAGRAAPLRLNSVGTSDPNRARDECAAAGLVRGR